jgi:hypothetical protein
VLDVLALVGDRPHLLREDIGGDTRERASSTSAKCPPSNNAAAALRLISAPICRLATRTPADRTTADGDCR